jgi:hypothetical protein
LYVNGTTLLKIFQRLLIALMQMFQRLLASLLQCSRGYWHPLAKGYRVSEDIGNPLANIAEVIGIALANVSEVIGNTLAN